MKIQLINLPWRENGRLGVRAGSRWPFTSEPEKDGRLRYIPFPFFLAYATALLKKNGYEAKLIDAIAEGISEQDCVDRVNSFRPGLIVAETSTPSFDNDIRILKAIRQNHPDVRIALCGPHACVFAGQILSEHAHIDAVLVGEYEFILLDLVRAYEEGSGVQSIPGVVCRTTAAGADNKSASRTNDLDSLPWPERGDVPLYNYNDGFCRMPAPNVQMMSSRGCPFRCIFCLWPQTIYGNRRYRRRNPQDVIREMEYLIRQYNFAAVYLDDDVFNIDRRHVVEICAAVKSRKLTIPWAAMARADLMDEKLIASLADAGMYAVKYGIESVDKSILRRCKKDMDIVKAKKMIKLTRHYGIKTHLTFCIGLPGESEATLENLLRFIDEVRPDSLQCSIATPFPGTDYFAYLKKKKLLLSERWGDYDGNRCVVAKFDELGQRELEAKRKVIEQRFGWAAPRD